MEKGIASIQFPENQKIIDRMQHEVNALLGAGTWAKITAQSSLEPDMDNGQLAESTYHILEKVDTMAGANAVQNAFCNVRHGLDASNFLWAREKFLEYNNIDRFAQAVLQETLTEIKQLVHLGEPFYGQNISAHSYEYLLGVENLFYGKRHKDKILANAIPFRLNEYLNAQDPRIRRYAMCHCQFARESILQAHTVSQTLCSCSLGHTMMFWETALDTKLTGRVISSALAGDFHCRFEIDLPAHVLKEYANG